METPLNFYRGHEIRARDLGFALHLAEELSPLPNHSRAALLILRDAVSNLTGVPICSLLEEFQAVETRAAATTHKTPLKDAST